MKTIKIQLIAETKNSTVSAMLDHTGGFLCFILEDGHREIKEPTQTRIKGDKYQFIKKNWGKHFDRYKKQYNHQFVISLLDVPEFEGINFHEGINVNHTDGCLLVSDAISFDPAKKEFYVPGARFTSVGYQRFYNYFEAIKNPKEYMIEVIRTAATEKEVVTEFKEIEIPVRVEVEKKVEVEKVKILPFDLYVFQLLLNFIKNLLKK